MTSKLLVLSDIHSNFPALEAVLADAEKHGPYDMLLNAGDVVGYGPNPNECIQRIRDFISILGNHDGAVRGDESVLHMNFLLEELAAHNRRVLNPEGREFLASLSIVPYVDPEYRFAMVHGSFSGTGVEKGNYFLITEERGAAEAMKHLFLKDDDDPSSYIRHIPLGILGHTHYPTYVTGWVDRYYISPYNGPLEGIKKFQFQFYSSTDSFEEGVLDLEPRIVEIDFRKAPLGQEDNEYCYPKVLFNPGSVGQPRHGSYAACYGIVTLDDGKITLEFRNVEYDVAKTQSMMRKEGLPQHLIERLSKGR